MGKKINFNKEKLSELSLMVMQAFIGVGEIIIKTAIDPYEMMRYGVDGKPKYYSTLGNLKRNKYLKSIKIKNKTYYKLTNKGNKAVANLIFKRQFKNKKWNGKWYVLTFDVPEKKRYYRVNLRRNLVNIGFYQLQKSVWVFPYDVIEYLYKILPGFREGDWFEYMEVNHISSQKKLIKLFNLTRK